jgi:microsomal dipeptidase-like Zn-dependent dipeptidase
MLGFSVYPHHLRGGGDCKLDDFCGMIARTVDLMGPTQVGIGTDLCQDQPDEVVTWMRTGRWTKKMHFGEGSRTQPGFPKMPEWFADNRDFGQIAEGLRACGLEDAVVAGIMGENWLRFFDEGFGAAVAGAQVESQAAE